MNENTSFRFADEKDCGIILDFIRNLAEYEKMSDQVVATEELLREWIFTQKKAEVILKKDVSNVSLKETVENIGFQVTKI